MINSSLKKRLQRLEIQLEPAEDFRPLFIAVVDGRRPGSDPTDLEPPRDYSSDGIIGVTFGASAFAETGGRVSRLPGESVEALEQRAIASVPGVPVFMYAYGCDSAHFDGQGEVEAQTSTARPQEVCRERYAPDEPLPDQPIW